MKIITKNKFAYSDYEIIETFDAGVVLKGYEVKSIKSGKVNIKDAIVKVLFREIYITNMDIPLYERTSTVIAQNYQQKGNRKLLLKKKEITRLGERTQKTGLTVVPLEVFITKTGFIKIKIGLGKLRKKIEKKQILKEKQLDKEAKKELKNVIFR